MDFLVRLVARPGAGTQLVERLTGADRLLLREHSEPENVVMLVRGQEPALDELADLLAEPATVTQVDVIAGVPAPVPASAPGSVHGPFDAAEWAAIVEAPVAAAAGVIAADQGGTLRETVSLARAYAEARESSPASGLLKAVLGSPPPLNPVLLQDASAAHSNGVDRLRAAIAALERKADPAELSDYRGFVSWLADKVARSHKEGGVLGIGGKEISDAEQAVLDDLTSALG